MREELPTIEESLNHIGVWLVKLVRVLCDHSERDIEGRELTEDGFVVVTRCGLCGRLFEDAWYAADGHVSTAESA